MKSYKISKNNSILLIVFVLVVSLLINVYTSIMNSRYKVLIGKETYKSVEEIRSRNEGVLNTLNQCIKARSISNEELLTLYKSYSSISEEFTSLWANYRDYGKEEIISIKKKSKISKEIPNEVYSRIESLLFEYLSFEMKNHNEKIILDGETLDNFEAMSNMATQLDEFYKEFNENKFKNVDQEKKELLTIKKDYWMDVLEGINSIMDQYLNYEFAIKN
ncbi:hypothetical protein PMY56_06750 [Clostridium tertium]|jgi:hypothetical protein|nr:MULTISPECIES: hypothetical protein [Clostridium]EEH98533.2 hypothetical protein CSBG_02159 [Clostridium sp. 7_2_43FAA]MBP1869211.1 hypothetical protein [Clostridium tertium]MBS5305451.1 hypothetical protein [Clostridium sp.]MBS6502950.1 hypothetical protein [Clostridium sp.]MDB1922771.1 hypothetical protein [Clostridium tertium]